ncbi:Uncharacterized protein SCF082_LOCUS40067 [Durusdinium trenchii]|uniref:Uncharacterized protein n=1 Tax=Durusdinium trenchii TaxID=1381693 RepID=A0ABP0Q8W8_9DINO
MAVDPENMSLTSAIDATEHLLLRELPAHVHVGPLPQGLVTPLTLPVKERVNTNLAEQVFAWFKNYAPVINEMRENRHRFLLLWLAKRHNDALLHGSASYLRSIPNSKSKTTSKSYNCSKNKKTPKGKKVKKTTMKGMKVKKVMKGLKVKGMKVKNVMKAMK